MRSTVRRAAQAVGRVLVGGLVLGVRGYQKLVSPLLGPCCRFAPSCSEYAVEALERHGVVRGLGLAAWRILRCHPFGEGGFDPVPLRKAAKEDISPLPPVEGLGLARRRARHRP
jgi:hypothetical protein